MRKSSDVDGTEARVGLYLPGIVSPPLLGATIC